MSSQTTHQPPGEHTEAEHNSAISRRGFLAAAGGVAGSVLLAGPGSAASAANRLSGARSAAAARGTLRWDTAVDPTPDLNPIGAGAAVAAQRRINAWVTNGLLRTSNTPPKNSNIESLFELDLAESYTVGNGGLLYTFKLRKGLTFSDGTPVTSADVAATYNAVLDPKVGSNWLSFISLGNSTVSNVATPDPHTVAFTLSAPNVFIINGFAQIPILPAADATNTNLLSSMPVGTGPFKIDSVQSGASVTLSRNPSYFRKGLPHLAGINYAVVTDPTTLLLDLVDHDAALTADLAYSQLPLAKSRGVKIYDVAGAPARQYMYVNVASEPWFEDINFRNAMSYAIDRKQICNLVFGGLASPAQGQYTPNTLYWDKSLKKFGPSADLKTAKALLAKAPTVTRPLTITTLGSDPLLTAAATVLQANWQKLGIEIQISSPDVPTAVNTLFGKTFDFFIVDDFLGTGPGFMPTYIFTSYGSGARFQFANPTAAENAQLDAIIQTAQSSQDPAKVRQACYALQKFDLQEQRVIATCYPHYVEAQGVKLSNYTPVRVGSDPYSVEDCSIA
jgi:peptide/nickel transport system substrate-binding protein